jgi:methylated-DNA-[protein]-cysteine S-methyltransferase
VTAEISYTVVDSPVGALLLAATDAGLLRVAYLSAGPEPVLEELVDRVSPRVAERPAGLSGIRRELDEYFAGTRRRFDTRLDPRLVTGFRRSVLEATAKIPYGEVATLRRDGAGRRPPRGGARRRWRARRQPDRDRDPLPPGAQQRRTRRIRARP